jgi:hypothetical protein
MSEPPWSESNLLEAKNAILESAICENERLIQVSSVPSGHRPDSAGLHELKLPSAIYVV